MMVDYSFKAFLSSLLTYPNALRSSGLNPFALILSIFSVTSRLVASAYFLVYMRKSSIDYFSANSAAVRYSYSAIFFITCCFWYSCYLIILSTLASLSSLLIARSSFFKSIDYSRSLTILSKLISLN